MYFSKGIKKFNFRFKTIFTNCIFITITINFSYFLRVFEIVNLYLNLKSVFKSIRGCGGGGAFLFLPCLKFLNNETRFACNHCFFFIREILGDNNSHFAKNCFSHPQSSNLYFCRSVVVQQDNIRYTVLLIINKLAFDKF